MKGIRNFVNFERKGADSFLEFYSYIVQLYRLNNCHNTTTIHQNEITKQRLVN